MSTFDDLVNDCLQTLQGYGLAQSRAAFLNSGIGVSDLTISVDDADGFEQGVAELDNEIVFINAVDYGSGVLTLAPDGRGFYGTTAAAHGAGTRITMAPVWPRNQIAKAINETILGTYPTLFGVGTTQFPFTVSVNTYALPADAEQVLKVTTETLGPSGEQIAMRRYSFNSNAPSDVYPTGNTITLEQTGWPRCTVTVTYKKQPSEITFGDQFTSCGLSETAKLAIKYGAVSALVALMDTSRLPVDTAQADEFDPSRAGVGTATRISAQLYQRYQIELENERKRLRAATPAPINVRTR